jgi:hypothetical protein
MTLAEADGTETVGPGPEPGARGGFLGAQRGVRTGTAMPPRGDKPTPPPKPSNVAKGGFLGAQRGARTGTAVPSKGGKPTPQPEPSSVGKGGFLGPQRGARTGTVVPPRGGKPTPPKPSKVPEVDTTKLENELAKKETALQAIQKSLQDHEELLAQRQKHLDSLQASVEFSKELATRQGRVYVLHPDSDLAQQIRTLDGQVKASKLAVQDEQKRLQDAQDAVTSATNVLRQHMDPAKRDFQDKLKAISPLLERARKLPGKDAKELDTKIQKCLAEAPNNYGAASKTLNLLEQTARSLFSPGKVRDRHQQAGLQDAACARNTAAALELSRLLLNDDGSLNVAALDQQLQAYAPPAPKPTGFVAAKKPGAPIEVPTPAPFTLPRNAPNTKRLVKTLERLKNDPALSVKLRSIDKPASDNPATALIRAALGLDPQEEVTAAHAQQAVLSSLLAELRQSDVGSCFGTCVSIKIHDHDPGQFLEDMKELINTGYLTRTLDGRTIKIPPNPAVSTADVEKKVQLDSDGTMVGKGLSLGDAPGMAAALDALGVDAAQRAGAVKAALTAIQNRASFQEAVQNAARQAAVKELPTAVQPDVRARVEEKLQLVPQDQKQKLIAKDAATADAVTKALEACGLSAEEAGKVLAKYQATLQAPAQVSSQEVLQQILMTRLGLTDTDLENYNRLQKLNPHVRAIRYKGEWNEADTVFLEGVSKLSDAVTPKLGKLTALERELQTAQDAFLAQQDNRLLRCWEYTISSLAEQRDSDSRKARIQSATTQAIGEQLEQIKKEMLEGTRNKKKGEKNLSRVVDVLAKEFGERFAAGVQIGYTADPRALAEDGSSSRGGWNLYDATGVKDKSQWIKIADRDSYSKLIEGLMLQACEAFDQEEDRILGRTIAERVGAAANRTDFLHLATEKLKGQSSANAQKQIRDPWALPGGSGSDPLLKAYYGKSQLTMAGSERAPANGEELCQWLFKEAKLIRDQLQASVNPPVALEDAMVPMSNNIHAFLLKPGHPSLNDVLSADHPEVWISNYAAKAKADAQAFRDGAATADLVKKLCDNLGMGSTFLEKVTTKLQNQPDAKVADLIPVVEQAIDETYPGKENETSRKYFKEGMLPAAALTTMLSALPEPPGLVFADTNWGGGDHQILFTMLTNPLNGELELWQVNEDGSGLRKKDSQEWITSGVWDVYTKPEEIGGV